MLYISVAVLGLFVLTWGFLNLTNGPNFCATCHTMKVYKDSHALSKHRGLSCGDCHAPHDSLVNKMIFKVKSGTRDLVDTVTRSYPPVFTLSADSKEIILANCDKCHQATISRISGMMDAKECYQCHRNIVHPRVEEE